MARKSTHRAEAPQPGAYDDVLDSRIKMITRALAIASALVPVAVALWRWRTVIRIAISAVMVALPVISRLRALRSAPAAVELPASVGAPSAIVVDPRELEILLEAEAASLASRQM